MFSNTALRTSDTALYQDFWDVTLCSVISHFSEHKAVVIQDSATHLQNYTILQFGRPESKNYIHGEITGNSLITLWSNCVHSFTVLSVCPRSKMLPTVSFGYKISYVTLTKSGHIKFKLFRRTTWTCEKLCLIKELAFVLRHGILEFHGIRFYKYVKYLKIVHQQFIEWRISIEVDQVILVLLHFYAWSLNADAHLLQCLLSLMLQTLWINTPYKYIIVPLGQKTLRLQTKT